MVKKELPILFIVTMLALGRIYDCELSCIDAIIEQVVLIAVMGWMTIQSMKKSNADDALETEMEDEPEEHAMSSAQAWIWLLA